MQLSSGQQVILTVASEGPDENSPIIRRVEATIIWSVQDNGVDARGRKGQRFCWQSAGKPAPSIAFLPDADEPRSHMGVIEVVPCKEVSPALT